MHRGLICVPGTSLETAGSSWSVRSQLESLAQCCSMADTLCGYVEPRRCVVDTACRHSRCGVLRRGDLCAAHHAVEGASSTRQHHHAAPYGAPDGGVMRSRQRRAVDRLRCALRCARARYCEHTCAGWDRCGWRCVRASAHLAVARRCWGCVVSCGCSSVSCINSTECAGVCRCGGQCPALAAGSCQRYRRQQHHRGVPRSLAVTYGACPSSGCSDTDSMVHLRHRYG